MVWDVSILVVDAAQPFIVNFLGPNDEYVTVGSDEGYFFIWKKEDGALHGIYEGMFSVWRTGRLNWKVC